MITLWNILFYQPLYNALVFFVGFLPHNSLFLAVVLLTIIVRFIISPLSYKVVKTQIKNKLIEPELREVKKIKDKQEQAKKTLEIYRREGINPFSSFFLLLIQFPIIIALYLVFRDGGIEINTDLLYSFVDNPGFVNTHWIIDFSKKNLILAFFVGVTQYIYMHRSSKVNQPTLTNDSTEQEKVMALMNGFMKYIIPGMLMIFSYVIGPEVSVYWVTSNLFMIIQELIFHKKLLKKQA